MSGNDSGSKRPSLRIRESRLQSILKEYQEMYTLLATWPAREIMMDFEKEWDEKRRRFLENHPNPPGGTEDLQ